MTMLESGADGQNGDQGIVCSHHDIFITCNHLKHNYTTSFEVRGKQCFQKNNLLAGNHDAERMDQICKEAKERIRQELRFHLIICIDSAKKSLESQKPCQEFKYDF